MTRSAVASYRFARDRPNAASIPPAPPARRINQNRSARNTSVGPNPKSRLSHQGTPVSSGWALMTTFFFCSSAERAFWFANAGISVRNLFVFEECPY